MPQYNNRTFSRDPNNMKNASDYINRIRAEGLYKSVSTNNKSNKIDDIAVLTRQGPKDSKCLFSVGGFNVSSYSLLLDITKGNYFTASEGRAITVNKLNFSGFTAPISSPVNTNINDCSATTIIFGPGKGIDYKVPINQTSDLFEGNYMVNKSQLVNDIHDISSCDCIIPNLYDLSGIGIDTTHLVQSSNQNNKIRQQTLARWGAKEPLRGFQFPSSRFKFTI